MKGRFCPKCGSSGKPFYGSFCVDCYLADHGAVLSVEPLVLKRCSRCLRVRSLGVWETGRPEHIEDIVLARAKTTLHDPKITAELIEPGEKKEIYKVTADGKLGGNDVSAAVDVLVKYESETCDVCSRKSGNYYEAIVQLRPKQHEADLDRLRSALVFLRNDARAMTKKDRHAEIFRVEPAKNGIDIYFGSSRAAKVAIHHLQATYDCVVKESFTLRGVEKGTGKNKYSVTYSVRL